MLNAVYLWPEVTGESIMKHTRIALYIDLLFCLVIMPLIIMLLPVDRWIVTNTAFLVTIVLYVYILYFLYRRIGLFRMFMRRKYASIAVIMLLLFGLTKLLTYFPMQHNDIVPDLQQLEARRNMRTQTVWFLFLVVTCFSLVIELIFELFRQILASQELAAQKDKAELALYKAQINPHFMFNTLNTLYGLMLSRSELAESAFVKFSSILRYMYEQTERELISIGDEMEYLRQYVDLQKLRLNIHTSVALMEDIDDESVMVPPMLFINFVENAFKYGTSPDTDCTVEIEVVLHSWLLKFRTLNSIIRKGGEKGETKVSGIGIENCRKRLQLLFPDRFELLASGQDGIYKVELTIHLKEDRRA